LQLPATVAISGHVRFRLLISPYILAQNLADNADLPFRPFFAKGNRKRYFSTKIYSLLFAFSNILFYFTDMNYSSLSQHSIASDCLLGQMFGFYLHY